MITAKNTKLISNTLETIFGKTANVNGKKADGTSDYIGLVVPEISTSKFRQLSSIVNEVEDNLTIKRSGTGLSVSFT